MGHQQARIVCAAITPAVVALTGLMSPTANATCASFFGFGSGGYCTSTPTSVAIAIGTDAAAHAQGFLGVALAAGDHSYAGIHAGSWLNTATAFGYSAGAVTGHVLSLAVAVGLVSGATAGASPGSQPEVGNVAIAFGPNEVSTHAAADGIMTVGFNLFSRDTVVRAGQGPLAIARSVGQKGATLTKSGPGINMTGGSVGGK